MYHEQLETVEQMEEEYGNFRKDLEADGHTGDPSTFVVVMWEWDLGSENYRLKSKDLVVEFLRNHRYADIHIEEMVRWMNKFDKTLEQKLLERVVIYVHDICKIDAGMIEHLCEQLKCSEYDLFNGFESLSQIHNIKLEQE